MPRCSRSSAQITCGSRHFALMADQSRARLAIDVERPESCLIRALDYRCGLILQAPADS